MERRRPGDRIDITKLGLARRLPADTSKPANAEQLQRIEDKLDRVLSIFDDGK